MRLHYYLGQKFRLKLKTGEVLEDVLLYVSDNGVFGGFDTDFFTSYEQVLWFKLLLRRTNDMTRSEKTLYYKKCKKISVGKKVVTVDTPESLEYLFERGIDCFDLIDKGFALDKNKEIG